MYKMKYYDFNIHIEVNYLLFNLFYLGITLEERYGRKNLDPDPCKEQHKSSNFSCVFQKK